MNEKNIMGMYIYETKKFYYIDTPIQSQTTIDKLRTTLLARDLIRIGDLKEPLSSQYKITTLYQAKLESWDLVPVHLSKHTEKHSKPVEEDQVSNIWD